VFSAWKELYIKTYLNLFFVCKFSAITTFECLRITFIGRYLSNFRLLKYETVITNRQSLIRFKTGVVLLCMLN